MILNAFALVLRKIILDLTLTRAFLTVLGTFFGAAALITMVTGNRPAETATFP